MDKKRELLIPFLMMIGSLVFIFFIIPSQTKTSDMVRSLQPSTFPTAAMVIILVASIIMILQILSGHQGFDKIKFESKKFYKYLVIFGGILLYIITIWNIGYYIATVIMLACYLKLYAKIKWLPCIVGIAIYLLINYAIFEYGLHITLPRGLLF